MGGMEESTEREREMENTKMKTLPNFKDLITDDPEKPLENYKTRN